MWGADFWLPIPRAQVRAALAPGSSGILGTWSRGGWGGGRDGGAAHTHPEHLPQVGVPEPEGDVGDV